MRITNQTDEPIIIQPGEHVDVDAGAIRKGSGKLMELVIQDTWS